MRGFGGIEEEMVRERLDRNLREAEERRVARRIEGRRPSVRARVAKRLFEAAVRVERDATWNAVWEKMEAPKNCGL